jgi:hypothetical protein
LQDRHPRYAAVQWAPYRPTGNSASGPRVDPTAMVGPWERVARPLVWDSVPPGAGRRRNSRPEAGTGSPAVALARGGAMLRFPLPFAARMETYRPPGRRRTGQNGPETAAVCLCAAAGGQGHPKNVGGHLRTGCPHVWPAMRGQGRHLSGRQGRPLPTGHGRRPAEVRVAPKRPAGGPVAGSPRGGLGGGGEVTLRSVALWGGDGKALRPPGGLLRLVVDRTGPGWGSAVVCCKLPLGHSVFFKNLIYTKTTSVYTRRQGGVAVHTDAQRGKVTWP